MNEPRYAAAGGLPDVNVWLALAVKERVHHEARAATAGTCRTRDCTARECNAPSVFDLPARRPSVLRMLRETAA